MTEGTKNCPACGQTIHAEAILCRFCKTRLDAPAAAPVSVPPPAPPPKSGFPTWIVILLVIGCGGIPFIAIVAAIAIPGLLQSQRASNERNASATLKTLTFAEADFRANDRDGNGAADFWTGDVGSLYTLKAGGQEIKLIEENVANADAQPLGPTFRRPKAGYWFVAIRRDEDGKPYDQGEGRNPAKFAFCAYPDTRSSGRLTFIVNEGNTVYRMDTGGRPVESWPKRLEAEGWAPLY